MFLNQGLSRTHVMHWYSVFISSRTSHSSTVPVLNKWVKPLQALIPPGGCRALCLGVQKDIPGIRGEGWERVHSLEGSSVWGFCFLAPWTSPVPRMHHHEGGTTQTRHLLRCAVRDELPRHSRLPQDSQAQWEGAFC